MGDTSTNNLEVIKNINAWFTNDSIVRVKNTMILMLDEFQRNEVSSW